MTTEKELRNEIEKVQKGCKEKWNVSRGFCSSAHGLCEDCELQRDLLLAELKGYQLSRKEILEFIEHERDNGNIESGLGDVRIPTQKGFSAALCLSALIKLLEGDKHDT